MRFILLNILFLYTTILCSAQNVELFEQFNGRFDYVAIGNTMNTEENGPDTNCTILTSSVANLNLLPQQEIQAAFLYWAGSGNGDFEAMLNDNPITAERTSSDALDKPRVILFNLKGILRYVDSLLLFLRRQESTS